MNWRTRPAIPTVHRPVTVTRTPARPTTTPDLVEIAVLEVASVRGGIPRSVLWAGVAARLVEIAPEAPAPEPDRVLRALAMCIVRGDLDEVDGRIVAAADGPAAASA